MAKKVILEGNNEPYSGYYRLKKESSGFLKGFFDLVLELILAPYYLYQLIIGYLLSFIVLDPLFRKDEKDDSLILKNPDHPDPLFAPEDEMNIINVVPKSTLLLRILLNWRTYFVNKSTPLKIINYVLNKIAPPFPDDQDPVNNYLIKLVNEVAEKIRVTDGSGLLPKQIHFRGMEKLSLAQKDFFYQQLSDRLDYDFRRNLDHLYFFSLKTSDNATLDSLEIRGPSGADMDITKRRFIILCMPRTLNYLHFLKQCQLYSRELDATVVTFNYRGVGLSEGLVIGQQSMYDDAYAQVQRLLAMGAKPENIAMMGECLGGNVATYIAGTHHLKLLNVRSFRSAASIVEGHILPAPDASIANPFTLLRWVLYGVVRVLITPLVISAGWGLNVEKQFLAIPPEDRDFIVVRSKKDPAGKRFADDLMIPHKHASIYSLAKEKVIEIKQKNSENKGISPEEQQWLADSLKQHKFQVNELLHENAKSTNGHIIQPQLLKPTNPEFSNESPDARQYSLNFFKRIWPQEKNSLASVCQPHPADQTLIANSRGFPL